MKHAGRLMSFAMTKDPILNYEKTVTRRDGWLNLKVGEMFWAVEKGMGLKRGEKVNRLRLLQCVENRRERLYKMIEDPTYGQAECILEGFPHLDPLAFVVMYIKAKRGRHAGDLVSRIEFRYVLSAGRPGAEGEVIKVPPRVAVCPSCGLGLEIGPDVWELLPDGTLACKEFNFWCNSPFEHECYLDWNLELENKIDDWQLSTFRFHIGGDQ